MRTRAHWMARCAVTAFVLALWSGPAANPALAQRQLRADIAGGYSMMRSGDEYSLIPFGTMIGHGWYADASGPLTGGLFAPMTRGLHFAFNGSGTYASRESFFTPTETDVRSNLNTYLFLIGGRFYFNGGAVRPFTNALLGGHFTGSTATTVIEGEAREVNVYETGLAWMAGAGADFRIAPTMSLRVSPEYVRTYARSVDQGSVGNYRLTIGIVYHSGVQ